MAFASDKGRQGAAGVSTGYDIDNSLRFNDDDSAYLSKVLTTPTDANKYSLSMWGKLGNIENMFLFGAGTSTSNNTYIRLYSGASQAILWETDVSASDQWFVRSNALLRDPSAWYHLMFVMDSSQSGLANQAKIYINGELASTSVSGTRSTDYTNTADTHYIGRSATADYYDGLMAEVNFVDGQALTPSDFGETDATYGHWKPKAYAGTYGTNGFYLDFKTSGSLGNDANGSNNWTPNNLAATDQMLDSPTNNFATFSPIDNGGLVLSEGNTKASHSSSSWLADAGTFGMKTGKWYWEILATTSTFDDYMIGIKTSEETDYTSAHSSVGTWLYYAYNGNKYLEGASPVAYGATFTVGDIIGVVLDLDSATPTLTFYKNNTTQGTADSNMGSGSDTFMPIVSMHGASSTAMTANFGQDSSFAGNKTSQGNADGNGIGDFYYTPPTGYLALCTQNLPEPTVVPSEHFDVRLRTGTGVEATVSDLGFQPDLLWTKTRSNIVNHNLHSTLMAQNYSFLQTNSTAAENSTATTYYMTPTSTGYTVGTGDNINQVSYTFVDWLWKANGAGVSNTNGSITSTVSANVDAGFSIVSYTGNGTSGATVGHGLSKAPEIIHIRERNNVDNWMCYNHTIGNTKYMHLNSTIGAGTYNVWNNTSPTTSVFSLANFGSVNTSSDTYIAYAFHSVEGYSKVGSYTGNGSTDGTFVHCGFRPAYVLVKRTDAAHSWRMFDSKRSDYNTKGNYLTPDSSGGEGATLSLDFLSNGFKIRTNNDGINGVGSPHIFIAFAETDFKHSNAR